jgi:putative hydrolase of the HAD superfamily
LGNVILNIDIAITIQHFIDLAPHKAEHIRSSAFHSPLFLNYETGHLSDEEFRQGIRREFSEDLSDEHIHNAWNALLLDIPPQRIELLHNLRKNYRTFLLSNTNQIHIDECEVYLQKTFHLNSFDDLFEKVYLSHRMGLRKPNVEIYQQVLSENNLKAEETVFLDDNFDNIKSSATLGIHSIQIIPSQLTVMDIFKKDEQGDFRYN